jgi:hypothetical protein
MIRRNQDDKVPARNDDNKRYSIVLVYQTRASRNLAIRNNVRTVIHRRIMHGYISWLGT